MTKSVDLESRIKDIQRVYNSIVDSHINEGMMVFSGAIFALAESLGRWYEEQTGEDPRDKMREFRERAKQSGKVGAN